MASPEQSRCRARFRQQTGSMIECSDGLLLMGRVVESRSGKNQKLRFRQKGSVTFWTPRR